MESNTSISSEEWKFVDGYDGVLQVSNMGRIRTVDRFITRSDTNTPVFIAGKVLKTNYDRSGYEQVRVSINNANVTFRIHREVAKLFIENLECKREVNHIDGDKKNNKASNLEWVTSSENQKHAVALGLKVHHKGKKAARFERSVDVFRGSVYITTLSGNHEMAEYGLDYRLVSACLCGKRHTHKGFSFKIHKE